MDNQEQDELYRKLGKLANIVAIPRKGVVTSTSPLTLEIAGGAPLDSGVHYLSSYVPTAGDNVFCLTWQNDALILGAII